MTADMIALFKNAEDRAKQMDWDRYLDKEFENFLVGRKAILLSEHDEIRGMDDIMEIFNRMPSAVIKVCE